MRATIAALVLCTLVAALAVAGAAAGSASSTGGERAPAGPPAVADAVQLGDGVAVLPAQSDDDVASNVTFNGTSPESIVVHVRADGDARFEVIKEFPAESEPQRASFEAVADDFQDDEYGLGLGFFRAVVGDVSSETGRSMDVDDVDRDVSTSEGTGRLTLSFTWTNFADVSESQVEVEDGFHVEGGVWLDSLGPEQELTLHAPEGYSVAHSESLVRDNAVVWEGPATFERGDFQTVFDSSGGFEASWLAVGTVGLLLLVVGGVGLFVYRRRSGEPVAERVGAADESGPTASGDGGETTDAGTAGQAAAAGAGAVAAEDDADGGGVAAGGASDGAASNGAASDGAASEESEAAMDPELLSDEERVEHLLERNGGRMKQARIVDETGWSNAKVSQLLSEMAESDRVDKLRLGRENLISLPDEDVTATE